MIMWEFLKNLAANLSASYIGDHSTLVGALIVVLTFLMVKIKISEIIKFKKLVYVVNTCARDKKLKITTVRNFLMETKEEALIKGDVVQVLTNDLQSYDLTSAAIDVIFGNINDGVKYIYYLNYGKYNNLETEKIQLFDALKGKCENNLSVWEEIKKNVIFKSIKFECLYNFALVRRHKTTSGYWYLATHGKESGPNLAIMELHKEFRDTVINVFKYIDRSENWFQKAKSYLIQ